jgi:hypothetical protein
MQTRPGCAVPLEVFTKFLSSDPVFAPAFPTIDEAENFYVSVRCGLLHEAQTKNGWTIWAGTDQGPIVDAKQKIVFRDKLQKASLRVGPFPSSPAARLSYIEIRRRSAQPGGALRFRPRCRPHLPPQARPVSTTLAKRAV